MGVLTAFCASYGKCMIPDTGLYGSVDSCVCLLQEYVGVLTAVYVCYRSMWEC